MYVNNVTIQLLPQLDGASFRLVGGNSLITNQKFNYEQKNTFAVKIRASDNGQPALSSEQILNILVSILLSCASLLFQFDNLNNSSGLFRIRKNS